MPWLFELSAAFAVAAILLPPALRLLPDLRGRRLVPARATIRRPHH
jgi:hypothetical protein